MKGLSILLLCICAQMSFAQFAPAANQAGTTAIHKDSSIIVTWATSVHDFQRGPQDIALGTPLAAFGDSTEALGYAEGNATNVVSLGDGGSITLAFDYPIKDEVGPDFAVFENSFAHEYLELAHVEVSTDGVVFVRIPSESQVQTATQTGPFMNTQANEIHNLAGKYIQGYGTPFDLEDVSDSSGINIDSINYVRLVDVVGVISGPFATYDALGTPINDPYPTEFESGGFDLDAIGVIHDHGPYVAETNEFAMNFSAYPNPTQNEIRITVSEPTEVAITNLNGQMLKSQWVESNVQIELLELGLAPGIYLIHANGVTKKIVLT